MKQFARRSNGTKIVLCEFGRFLKGVYFIIHASDWRLNEIIGWRMAYLFERFQAGRGDL